MLMLYVPVNKISVIFLCANLIVKYPVNIDLYYTVGGSSEKELNIPCISRYFPDKDIPVGWFSGSDVRTKSFFSPPSYGLILVLLYLVPSYLVVWCGD